MAVDENPLRSPIIGNLRLTPPPTDSTAAASSTGPNGEPADQATDAIIELNGRYPDGVRAALIALLDLWTQLGLSKTPATPDSLPTGLRRVTAVCYQATVSRLDIYRL